MSNKIMKRPVLKITAGLIIGGMVGFIYYWFVGCRTGNCIISGNPVNSVLYGSLLGLIWSIPLKKRNQK
jgi:ABC-type uncharacterized transport system permease subunit